MERMKYERIYQGKSTLYRSFTEYLDQAPFEQLCQSYTNAQKLLTQYHRNRRMTAIRTAMYERFGIHVGAITVKVPDEVMKKLTDSASVVE